MSGGGDKTEAPTQRRKEKAAEDGNILKSKDFATALVVMAGVAWLIFAGPSLIAACKAVMTASFQFDRTDVEDFSPWRPLQQAGAAKAILTRWENHKGGIPLSSPGDKASQHYALLCPPMSPSAPSSGSRCVAAPASP